jgi:hypothetical protein
MPSQGLCSGELSNVALSCQELGSRLFGSRTRDRLIYLLGPGLVGGLPPGTNDTATYSCVEGSATIT